MSLDAARSAPSGTAPPARRTRLTPERERELFEAVKDLLAEVGFDALTMDAVAARTRSSKATLYRQWKGKVELVATALRETKPVHVEDIDTGTLTGDLYEVAQSFTEHDPRDTSIMRALAHAAERDPSLARALREALIDPELQALDRLLDRAVARGELAADRPARAYLPQMMLGAVFARPLLEEREADAAYLREYMDAVVLPALGVSR